MFDIIYVSHKNSRNILKMLYFTTIIRYGNILVSKEPQVFLLTKKGNNCYTSKQVSGILGISKRQLQYWDETGLLKPSRMPACGSGTIRCYTFTDIVQLKIIRRLRDEQISLQKIRKAINYLQGQLEKGNLSFKNPLAELSFVTDGNDIYELKQDKQFAFDLLMNGQIVWYFPIEKTIREVRELEAKFFESILPRTGTQ